MDCFFHHAVPSVAQCTGCRKSVCATCRNAGGECPSCVMAAKIDSARRRTMVGGGVGPSAGAYSAPPPPEPEPAPQPQPSYHYHQHTHTPVNPRSSALAISPVSRGLAALGYPFWPLALIALLDSRGSHFVRRQAWQALGFNAAAWCVFVPIISMTLLPFAWLIPLFAFVLSVVYAAKVWGGEDVSVPVVSELVDNRLTA